MAHPVIIPAFGTDIPTAEIVRWHLSEGTDVAKGALLLDIQADKAVLEIESPADGVLLKQYAIPGSTVPAPSIVGYVGQPGETVPDSPPRPDAFPDWHTDVEPPAISEPMPLMRTIVGRRMHYSKQTMPHFYVTVAIDMTDLMNLRKEARREHGLKASVNDFIVKAAALTLRECPKLNNVCVGSTIHSRESIHIGVAMALEEGLVAPVIRNADELSLQDIHLAGRDLLARAREKKLLPHEYNGGTFTVSNMGMLGVDEFIAIIIPGQSAILAVGNAVDTPVVRKGEITVRTLMKMTLSSDHRVIDGAIAAQFMKKLKEKLENTDLWIPMISS